MSQYKADALASRSCRVSKPITSRLNPSGLWRKLTRSSSLRLRKPFQPHKSARLAVSAWLAASPAAIPNSPSRPGKTALRSGRHRLSWVLPYEARFVGCRWLPFGCSRCSPPHRRCLRIARQIWRQGHQNRARCRSTRADWRSTSQLPSAAESCSCHPRRFRCRTSWSHWPSARPPAS